MTIRHNFIYFDTLTSTNAVAEKLLQSEKPPEATVVYAREQTSGVGLGNNKWHSLPGMNLTASVILYPSFLPAEDQFQLTKLLSLSVCNLLEKLDPKLAPQIKWPNDIYCGGKKIAGLLIRNSISGNKISNTVAGLGLNVNQAVFGPEAPLATSITRITGKTYDISQLLTKWHDLLMELYSELKQSQTVKMDKQYLSKLYLLNEMSYYEIKGELIQAIIQGIGPYGMLMLKAIDGREFLCSLKELVFIPQ